MIKEYPDLEIANINKFMGYVMESTKTLVIDVDMVMEIMGRLVKVKDKDDLDPELEELAGPQEAHDTRRSPAIGGKKGTR